MLGIKVDFGGVLAPPHCPQMTDVSLNRCGAYEKFHRYISVESHIIVRPQTRLSQQVGWKLKGEEVR